MLYRPVIVNMMAMIMTAAAVVMVFMVMTVIVTAVTVFMVCMIMVVVVVVTAAASIYRIPSFLFHSKILLNENVSLCHMNRYSYVHMTI